MVYLGFNRSSIQLSVLEFIVLLHCLDYFVELSKIHFYHKCIQRYTNRNTRVCTMTSHPVWYMKHYYPLLDGTEHTCSH